MCGGRDTHGGTVVLSVSLEPYPRRKRPRRSGVWPPISANSSGYAPRALEKGSGPGADQVANGLVHGAVFVGRGHDAAGIKPCHHASSSV